MSAPVKQVGCEFREKVRVSIPFLTGLCLLPTTRTSDDPDQPIVSIPFLTGLCLLLKDAFLTRCSGDERLSFNPLPNGAVSAPFSWGNARTYWWHVSFNPLPNGAVSAPDVEKIQGETSIEFQSPS